MSIRQRMNALFEGKKVDISPGSSLDMALATVHGEHDILRSKTKRNPASPALATKLKAAKDQMARIHAMMLKQTPDMDIKGLRRTNRYYRAKVASMGAMASDPQTHKLV